MSKREGRISLSLNRLLLIITYIRGEMVANVGVLEGEYIKRVTPVVQILLVQRQLRVLLTAYRAHPLCWLHLRGSTADC